MSTPLLRIGVVLLLLACGGQRTSAQVGWRLDTTFRMPYSPWGVNAIHFM